MGSGHHGTPTSKSSRTSVSAPSSSKLPSTSIFLDNRLPIDYFKQDILKIIHRLKIHKLWKFVTPEMASDLVVDRMSGALTNAVYCVAPPPYIKNVIKAAQNASVIGGVDQKTGQQVLFNPPSPQIGPTGNNEESDKQNADVLSDHGAGPHDAYNHTRVGSTGSIASNGSATNLHKPSTKVPPRLLLRIYGPHVENLIDREAELNVLDRLSKRHIGPRLLGTFANGRFEQFLNAKALTREELRVPEVSSQIAKRMRELHDLIRLDDQRERQKGPEAFVSIKKWAAPAKEKLQQLQDFSNKTGKNINVTREIFGVDTYDEFEKAVSKYEKWLQSQYSVVDLEKDDKDSITKVRFDLKNLSKEMETAGQQVIKQSLVFAHNDTQYGNLLRVLPPAGSPLLSPVFEHRQIIVIDFEYSGANVRGFDICNHFCEWMSNYHDEAQPWKIHIDKYPTKSQRRNMIEAYVEHGYTTRSMVGSSSSGAATPGLKSRSMSNRRIPSFSLNESSSGNLHEYFDDAEIEAEVEFLEKEAMVWRATVSAHWAIWGLVQAVVDGVAEEKTREEQDIEEGYVFNESEVGSTTNGTDTTAQTAAAEPSSTNSNVAELAAAAAATSLNDAASVSSEEEEDLFDYIAYAKEKLKLFWGDMIKLGIVAKEEYSGTYFVVENDDIE